LGIIVEAVTHDEPAVLVQVGELTGEYASLLNRPQPATCIAIRDTSVAWLSRQGYESLIRKHPGSVLPFAAQLIELLTRALSFRRRIFTVPKTVGLIPLHRGAPVERLAAALIAALGKAGRTAVLLDSTAAKRGRDFIQAVETDHDLVVYVGDTTDSDWTRTCVRQSDHVLLAAAATEAPHAHAGLLEQIKELPWRHAELLLVQEDGNRPAAPAEAWLRHFPVRFHCHLRLRSDTDMARLARYVTGRGLGLVLSGGGARGFAHIGVIKALRQARIPIDLVGGTSMGAIIAAGVALEWDDKEMYERMHAGFVRSNPLDDYAFPLVALTKGRKVERRLRRHFADARVEDLWRPYFAVASNLSNGEVTVMRNGVLWRALRASIAIPGLLPPVIENDDVLADGGLMNNLPCDVMDAMRRGPVIGVDVTRYRSFDMSNVRTRSMIHRLLVPSDYDGPEIVSLLLRAATVGGTLQTRSSRDHADLVLDPSLPGIEIRDWKSFDRAIEEGYRYTMERIGELERFRENAASSGTLR
ncbi:MAG TPA: patatin-like phospholipase family protein, partial [Stellaceae bacterium]|nr:patatin-like phospholipase family protein [Stellaceae bacterium]